MKILYAISSNSAGKGGHFHSLDHISNAAGDYADVKVISVGNTESPVLKRNPYYLKSFPFKWYSFWSLNKDFKDLLQEYSPDIIHCFDGGTALLLMTLPALKKVRLMYTKCGGPNERKMFAQASDTVILFSRENVLSYKSNPRFRGMNIHHIPNRVYKVNCLAEADRPYKKDGDCFTFIRISRIGKTYKNSILQSVEIIRKLHGEFRIKLIIAGTVEDPALLTELKNNVTKEGLPVEFITGKYTEQASSLLYLADAVVGTGRGVMEAMSLGIPVLAPVKDRMFPLLVSETTVEKLFQTNFSQRSSFEDKGDPEMLEQIRQLIRDKEFYAEQKEFAKNYAAEFFMLNDEVMKKYLSIYEDIRKRKKRHYLLRNLIPLAYYINAYRRAMNRKPSG